MKQTDIYLENKCSEREHLLPQYSGTQLLRITPEEAQRLNAKDSVEAAPSPYTIQPQNQGNRLYKPPYSLRSPALYPVVPSPSHLPSLFPAPSPTHSSAPSSAPSPPPLPAPLPLLPRKVSLPDRSSRSGQVFHSSLHQQVLPHIHLVPNTL